MKTNLGNEPVAPEPPAGTESAYTDSIKTLHRNAWRYGWIEGYRAGVVAKQVAKQGTYDFDYEAHRVTEAIGSDNGHMTIVSALHEAYEAGVRSR